jgi:hypothetical protein
MFTPSQLFKNPVILEPEEHKNLKVLKPDNYSFMEGVEIIPLGYSEILPATMYYPVFFGMSEGMVFPFAVLGVQGKNPYLTKEGSFKIDYIPKLVKFYPFGLVYLREEGKENFLVAVDERFTTTEEGEPLFTETGEETSFFAEVKKKLTDLALDLKKALEFSQDLLVKGCITQTSFVMNGPLGKVEFKNLFLANIETLRRLQPEKLYYLNTSGYLPVLYGAYFSVRNFKIFELLYSETIEIY